MIKKILLTLGIVLLGLIAYHFIWTGNPNERRLRKNIIECLEAKELELAKVVDFDEVRNQAKQYFAENKNSNKAFINADNRERLIDDYVFLSRDNQHCLMMLLIKGKEEYNSSTVRIIKGIYSDNKWNFKPGMTFIYDNVDIKPLFPEKYKSGARHYDFEMLAERAKISIVNTRNKINGCNMDEDYWFKD